MISSAWAFVLCRSLWLLIEMISSPGCKLKVLFFIERVSAVSGAQIQRHQNALCKVQILQSSFEGGKQQQKQKHINESIINIHFTLGLLA